MNHVNAVDAEHTFLVLIIHKSFALARATQSSIKPFVKNRQDPSKLTPVSVGSSTNRTRFPTNSFLITGFFCAFGKSEAQSPLIMPLFNMYSPAGERHPRTPRSCAPNEADASDNLHPQLLLLSLRSKSQQVPASTRERLRVCSSIPACMQLLLKVEEEPSCCSPWNQLCT